MTNSTEAVRQCIHAFVLLQQTKVWRPSKQSALLLTDMEPSHQKNLLFYLIEKNAPEWAHRHMVGSMLFRYRIGQDIGCVKDDVEFMEEDPQSYLADTPLVGQLMTLVPEGEWPEALQTTEAAPAPPKSPMFLKYQAPDAHEKDQVKKFLYEELQKMKAADNFWKTSKTYHKP